jgi:hypothetical protein
MPKRVAPLNAKQLANWKPAKAGEELIDGAAPGLRAHRFTKGLSWSLSIRINGKRRRIALGYGLGLAEAREKARSVIASCNAAPHIAAPRNAVNASRVNLSELLLAKLRELIREAITELLSDGDVLARIMVQREPRLPAHPCHITFIVTSIKTGRYSMLAFHSPHSGAPRSTGWDRAGSTR